MGFPCRVTLEDAAEGQTLLLLNYQHQEAETPYRSSHAIYVSEAAREAASFVDVLPPCLAVRPHISVRAFNAVGMMTAAELSPGADLIPVIEKLLADPQVAYLHAHNAGRGCFAARIDRN